MAFSDAIWGWCCQCLSVCLFITLQPRRIVQLGLIHFKKSNQSHSLSFCWMVLLACGLWIMTILRSHGPCPSNLSPHILYMCLLWCPFTIMAASGLMDCYSFFCIYPNWPMRTKSPNTGSMLCKRSEWAFSMTRLSDSICPPLLGESFSQISTRLI